MNAKDGFLGTRFAYSVDLENEVALLYEHDTVGNIHRNYLLQVGQLREQVMQEALAKLGYKLVKIDEEEINGG